jgi:hypothetical protein
MSRESMFKDAFAKRKKAEEEKKERQSGNFTAQYEDIKYCAPEKDRQKAFRFLGLPPEYREKPTDAKIIKFSRWVSDKGKKYSNIIWKITSEGELDESWILTEFYQDVMSSTWVDFTEEETNKDPKHRKGCYKYNNEGSPAFQRIFTNSTRGDLYPPNHYPSNLVLQNCLDRSDNWNKEFKHSKLFVKRLDSWEDQKTGQMIEYAREPGYTISLLNMIYTLLADSPIFVWSDVDLIFKKTDDQAKYSVRSACSIEISEEMKKIASKEPLTDEEKSYELYDLEKLFPVTSYNKIKRNFLNLFKSWDAETGSNYTERLEALAETERKEREEQTKKEEEEKVNKIAESIKEEERTESESEDTSTRETVEEKVVERETVEKVDPLLKLKSEIFPFYNNLSPADKNIIDTNLNGFDEVNKKVLWKCKVAMCDPTCTFEKYGIRSTSPLDISQCPVCGKKFGGVK